MHALSAAAFVRLLCSCFICFVFLDSAWVALLVLELCVYDRVCRRLNNNFEVIWLFAWGRAFQRRKQLSFVVEPHRHQETKISILNFRHRWLLTHASAIDRAAEQRVGLKLQAKLCFDKLRLRAIFLSSR